MIRRVTARWSVVEQRGAAPLVAEVSRREPAGGAAPLVAEVSRREPAGGAAPLVAEVSRRELGWPESPDEEAPRRDWRETVRNASDLALLGIVSTIAALPVLTAGAAVGTASAAVHHWIEQGSWPGVRPVLRGYVRGLLPGAGATLVGGLVAAVLGVNLYALGRGLVPGGAPLVIATGGLAAAAGGLIGLTVVELGRRGGQGWLAAARTAGRTALARPVALLAAIGVLVLAAVLGALILPVLTPILAGYTLFALHAADRGRRSRS